VPLVEEGKPVGARERGETGRAAPVERCRDGTVADPPKSDAEEFAPGERVRDRTGQSSEHGRPWRHRPATERYEERLDDRHEATERCDGRSGKKKHGTGPHRRDAGRRSGTYADATRQHSGLRKGFHGARNDIATPHAASPDREDDLAPPQRSDQRPADRAGVVRHRPEVDRFGPEFLERGSNQGTRRVPDAPWAQTVPAGDDLRTGAEEPDADPSGHPDRRDLIGVQRGDVPGPQTGPRGQEGFPGPEVLPPAGDISTHERSPTQLDAAGPPAAVFRADHGVRTSGNRRPREHLHGGVRPHGRDATRVIPGRGSTDDSVRGSDEEVGAIACGRAQGEPVHGGAVVRRQRPSRSNIGEDDATASGGHGDHLCPAELGNFPDQAGQQSGNRDAPSRHHATAGIAHPESSSGGRALNAFTNARKSGRPSSGPRVVVLAGGRSSRFGRDKLRARIDGRASLARVVARVTPIASEVIVATSSETRRRGLARLVARSTLWSVDRSDAWGPGPGGAIARTLADSDASNLLVVPGDIPWIETAALRRFIQAAEGSDVEVAVPVWGSGETEHLLQWHRGARSLDFVGDAVRGPRGTLRASEFLRAVPTTLVVPISELTRSPGTFAHLTYPRDRTEPAWRGSASRVRRRTIVEGRPKRYYFAARQARAAGDGPTAERSFRSESRWYARAELPILARHAEDDARATVNRPRRLRRVG